MAPNSQFGFPIPLNGAPLEAGEYTLEMTAKAMGAEWSWSEPFTIDADEAGQLNATDVSIPPTDYTWLYVSIGIALVFASIILFLVAPQTEETTSWHGNSEEPSCYSELSNVSANKI